MGADGPITDPLDIADPAAMSVIPGGASREIMKTDAFVPAYVIYPLPGCWDIDAHVRSRDVRIVVELAPAPNR